MVTLVLAVRFLMELGLLVAAAIVGAALAPTPWSVLLGLAAVIVVSALWGLVLSPRARVHAPLGLRLVIEIALVGVVSGGLWWSGHAWAAAALVGTDLAILGLLVALGHPPGRSTHLTRHD